MDIDIRINDEGYIKIDTVEQIVNQYKGIVISDPKYRELGLVFDSIVACLTDKEMRRTILEFDVNEMEWLRNHCQREGQTQLFEKTER